MQKLNQEIGNLINWELHGHREELANEFIIFKNIRKLSLVS